MTNEQRPTPSGGGRGPGHDCSTHDMAAEIVCLRERLANCTEAYTRVSAREYDLSVENDRLRRAIAVHNTRVWHEAINRRGIGDVTKLGMISVGGPSNYPLIAPTDGEQEAALPQQRHHDEGDAEQHPEQGQHP